MATFPKTESEIVGLADSLASGLVEDAEIFEAPPVTPTELNTLLATLKLAQKNADVLRGQAEAATVSKLAAIEALAAAMKKDLKYAEYTCDYDDAVLKQLGWGARKDPTPMPPPGTPTDLNANPQGTTSVLLSWTAPLDGGTVSTYKIQRKRTDGLWEDAGVALETSIDMTNQSRGVELEFRVIASNKAGDSAASNTVVVVL